MVLLSPSLPTVDICVMDPEGQSSKPDSLPDLLWNSLAQPTSVAKQPVPILQETGVSEELELPEVVAAPRPCASAHFASSLPPRMSAAAVLHGSLWADSPWDRGADSPSPQVHVTASPPAQELL